MGLILQGLREGWWRRIIDGGLFGKSLRLLIPFIGEHGTKSLDGAETAKKNNRCDS